MNQNFTEALRSFASDMSAKFQPPLIGQLEDKLKSPVESLLKAVGHLLNLDLKTATEVRADEIGGRPDVGVTVKSLLTGYIELKAPGKGADTKRFKGRDKEQWTKFKDLPNVVYTDGIEWALYRNGELFEKLLRLPGDVTRDQGNAIDDIAANSLLTLFREFLRWEPQSPSSPKALAGLLAPVCRLLRADVLAAIQDSGTDLSTLAEDWRTSLFPDADDKQFADAYAQTLTYALLLARLLGTDHLTIPEAVKSLRTGHQLLSDALKVLGDDAARKLIEVPVSLLERMIAAVNVEILTKKGQGDPWLYFYEDFLAAYDPQMRKRRGVYYTPVAVVQAQVRLVSDLLENRFGAEDSFADSKVVTLDPATGTGTYILAAVQHGIDRAAKVKGPGKRPSAATTAAKNIHAFEILVGPYAVAHLRLTQQIRAEDGTLPKDGVHVYLNDTLDSPYAEPRERLSLSLKQLGAEHKRAQKVKANTPIVVCIGNPPYNRQTIRSDEQDVEKRKGGWVRYGDGKTTDKKNAPILHAFIDPLQQAGLGVHAKNLYNDYVYFWRWALWKVFEAKQQGGIVSFITASSYLRGKGFAGMRKVMRETFDDLWIIDLEGGNLGARKTENVFAIQTPVAIAVGVRYEASQPTKPATVYYSRIEGSQKEKLDALGSVTSFEDLNWQKCPNGWLDDFQPALPSVFFDWPLLTNLFPWQTNGMQFKRSWPIGESIEVLERRWQNLLAAKDRSKSFKESRDRTIDKQYPSVDGSDIKALPIAKLKDNAPLPPTMRATFRSFDRQWVLADSRVGDYLRPTLHLIHSDHQVYLTSLLTEVLGQGPSAVATGLIPDLHCFRGSFGGAHVIPLWRDKAGQQPNITHGVLSVLETAYGQPVTSEDLFAYCYGVLATPDYVRHFWEELRTPGPRMPISRDINEFVAMAKLGRQLLWLHTFCERFVPINSRAGKIPPGQTLIKVGTPNDPTDYPKTFAYDLKAEELNVGAGIFQNVRAEVWNFSVSGLPVVASWLGYRMQKRSGKSSSPLDDIRPERWEFDDELLELLWIIDNTVDLLPQATRQLDSILSGSLFSSSEFPIPTQWERTSPHSDIVSNGVLTLDLDESDEEDDWESDEEDDEQ